MLKIKSLKEQLSVSDILNYVRKHEMVLHHYIHLKAMYDNKNDIKHRIQQDASKPNNKISHAYASYITDVITGYFMGKPISYSFEDDALAEQFNDIFKYNDESAENVQLATDASIYGCAVELLYVDTDLMPRFKAINPCEVIAVYDCSIEENLIGAIRHWEVEVDEEQVDYVEYYTKDKVVKFTSNKDGGLISGIEEQPHYFGDVPIVVVENNKDCCSDFGKVVDLIDAVDKAVSDTANDFEMFTNCIMLIKGAELTDEVAEQIRTMRILNLVGENGEQVDAQYLTKNIPDVALENYKNRLVEDIHKFAGVPNMSDENFGNNLSGVSIQFKLSNLEFKCATKEAYFRKAMLRRIELICNLQGLLGKVGNVKDVIKNVDIRFTRNTINNTNEIIQQALQLSTLVSKETVLEMLTGFINSVDEEKERLDAEREENIAMFGSYSDDEFGHDEDEEETWDISSKDKEQEEEQQQEE